MINLTGFQKNAPSNDSETSETPQSIRLIESESELASLKEFWRNATREEESPFSTWDWNRAWLRHFGRNEDRPTGYAPFFLVSECDSGEPHCIFPFQRTEETLDLAGAEICDFQDVIASEEEKIKPALEALLSWVGKEEVELSLTKLSERGKLLSAIETQSHRDEHLFDFQLHGPCPWMRIRGNGVEGVTAQFSKSTRKGLRRRVRQLREKCNAEVRVLESLEEEFLQSAAGIHRDRHEESVFLSETFLEFLQEIDRSDEIGLTAFALESGDGDLIAFEIGFCRGGRYFSWLGGYDPGYSDYRPGTSLQTLVMVELAERDIREYDFLCGGEQYKFQFAEEEYQVRTARVLRRNPLQTAMLGIQRAERKVRPFVKRGLQRAGLYRTSYRIDAEI